jgi:AcrR family transcriptional regulator
MARSSGAKIVGASKNPDGITRRGLRTKGTLLKAARRVFERRGYHNTRINDITDDAKVSVGTFYAYFGSKEDIFRSLLIHVEYEVYGELATQRQVAKSPRESISETNRLYLASFQRNARFWTVVEESALSDHESARLIADRRNYYHGRTQRALDRWQQQGAIRADIDTEFAALALGAMTERCAYLWFVFGVPVDITTAADRLTGLWLSALGLGSGDDVAPGDGAPLPVP